MEGGFASVAVDEGVQVTSADVDGLTVSELAFPAGYAQRPFAPELPYLALVLEGSMEKRFALRTISFGRSSALTMPAGALHSARFGERGARILVVRPRDPSAGVPGCLARLTELRGRGYAWLGWRLAAELRASDVAAPLAAEGLALELLAAASRDRGTERSPRWLAAAEELLRARLGECARLGDLAREVGVHPAHLARQFRARHGVSVGEYGRRLRLEWAASQIAASDRTLAEIAIAAGFADQSHFTRLFTRHVGTTPARYRDATRVPR